MTNYKQFVKFIAENGQERVISGRLCLDDSNEVTNGRIAMVASVFDKPIKTVVKDTQNYYESM